MNNSKPKKQVNDYVLLFSAGAALSVIFLWLASYIFPEGEIIGGEESLKIYLNQSNIYFIYLVHHQYLFVDIYFLYEQKIGQEVLKKKEK